MAGADGRGPGGGLVRADRAGGRVGPVGHAQHRDRADGGWIINGQKRFITNAPIADLFVAFAKDPVEDQVAVFLVPADTPGVTVGPKDHKMGQEGATTADVTFDGVRVDADALVSGEVQTGFRAAMTVLARGRVHISALAMGLAQRALDESVAYAAQVRQGGVLIGERQLVQAMLAEQQSLVMAGTAMVRETARRYPTAATAASARRPRSCSARRPPVGSPTSRCRCTAAAATCARRPSSGSTATSACCGSTRAPARSRS